MAAGFVLRCKIAYASFERALYSFRSPLLLLVRLYWGFQFMMNGWGKLHNLPNVTQFFVSLHVPMAGVMAPAIALLEFGGGIFLMLGLLSRLTALLLALDMIVAFLLADRDALSTILSSDPSKFYSADPFTFLCACIVITVFGTGFFSLDYLLAGRHEVN